MRRPLQLAAIAAAGLVAACNPDFNEPMASPPPPAGPSLNHTTPEAPPATIAVNNYTAEFFRSGLKTFYKGQGMLFTGGIAYGTSGATAHIVNTGSGWFDVAETGLPVHIQAPGAGADHYSATVLAEQPSQSLGTKLPLGIVTVRETYAFANAPHDDYLIVKYSLTNTTSSPITDLHVGYMADPDVSDAVLDLQDEYAQNVASYDFARDAAITRVNGGTTTHAIVSLENDVAGYYSWMNSQGGSFPQRDPATNDEWFGLMSGGANAATAGPGDIRQYLGTSALSLAPGETKVFAFALIGGDDAPDIAASIAQARAKAGTYLAPRSSVRATVSIIPGTSVWTARITFPSTEQAAAFDQPNARCGGAPTTSHVRNGAVVDLTFDALAIDSRRRSGQPMHCAGLLSTGSYFAGTAYPTFDDGAIPVARLTNHAAYDDGATWSPDGSRIAFVSGRDGSGVFVMDLAGGDATATRVASIADPQQVSWSSTGNLAFARGSTIWRVPAAGGVPTQLATNGNDPRWSPDGTRIAFRRQGNLWTMNGDGTNQALGYTGGLYPEWIGANTVLFSTVVVPTVDERVYTMELGLPSTLKRLTPPEPGFMRFPAMSPDGKTIAFLYSGQIVTQDLESGQHTMLSFMPAVSASSDPAAQNLEWSPDGLRLLFMSNNGEIYVAAMPHPGTSAERVVAISSQVASLLAGGLLTDRDAATLNEALTRVGEFVARGSANAAVNHVNAFINKVNALMNSRRLSTISGEQLTDEALSLAAQLEAASGS